MKEKKKLSGINWKQIAFLQVIVFAYSFISMLSKCVSFLIADYGLISIQVFAGLSGVFLALVIYAFLWQRVLKKVDLSIAYANKAAGLLWTLVWSALLFGETITARNVIGLIVICIGVLVVTDNE